MDNYALVCIIRSEEPQNWKQLPSIFSGNLALQNFSCFFPYSVVNNLLISSHNANIHSNHLWYKTFKLFTQSVVLLSFLTSSHTSFPTADLHRNMVKAIMWGVLSYTFMLDITFLFYISDSFDCTKTNIRENGMILCLYIKIQLYNCVEYSLFKNKLSSPTIFLYTSIWMSLNILLHEIRVFHLITWPRDCT